MTDTTAARNAADAQRDARNAYYDAVDYLQAMIVSYGEFSEQADRAREALAIADAARGPRPAVASLEQIANSVTPNGARAARKAAMKAARPGILAKLAAQ